MQTVPVVLLAALVTQIACQIFKVISGSIEERRFQPKNIVQSGGMPSSHAAFVTSLSVAIGIQHGFCSDFFAIAAVFSIIVIHDAVRLRGTVEKQGRIIRQLTRDKSDFEIDLPKTVGHNIKEVIVGMIVGAVGGSIVALIF